MRTAGKNLDLEDLRWLRGQVDGPVLVAGEYGYPEETATFNQVLTHRPVVVAGATNVGDVQNAIRLAARRDLPVSVNATGHGAVVSADGSVMISTRRMTGVAIRPDGFQARVQAGVRWQQVIDRAAEVGLAPLAGSAPLVGAVGYTLGGGLSPVLGRSHGYAADHVREFEIVTADGVLRRVSAELEADLFWAVRGGKGNFGVVTALEFDLFPITRLYGGGLFFDGEHAAAVLHTYREWVADLPDEVGTSFVFLRLPDLPSVPEPMRNRLTLHVRFSYLGNAAAGARIIAPIRAAAPAVLDTVTEMPFRQMASIHNDPAEPCAAIDRTTLLRELSKDGVDTLLELAGPDVAAQDTLLMVEVRLLGGALSRPPAVPNAVGNRAAAFNLFVASIAAPGDEDRIRAIEARILAAMAPWATGGAYANFLSTEDVTPELVRKAFDPPGFDRLRQVKASYDPGNTFRVNHNIQPS